MFVLLHKLSRQIPALILFWCINWVITLILLAIANKTHHPSLVGVVVWFNMLWLCAYIIEYRGSTLFHAQESKRLKRFFAAPAIQQSESACVDGASNNAIALGMFSAGDRPCQRHYCLVSGRTLLRPGLCLSGAFLFAVHIRVVKAGRLAAW